MSYRSSEFDELRNSNNRFAKSISSTKQIENKASVELKSDQLTTLQNDIISVQTNAQLDNNNDVSSPNFNTESNDNDNTNSSKNILNKVLQKEKNKGRNGLNHSLYLSKEVSDMINKLAKRSGKSKSTLVDEVLKEVFFNN